VNVDLILAGTGHRPSRLAKGYSSDGFQLLVDLASECLAYYLTKVDTLLVVSGMAQGWDQALASAAVSAGIPWIAAVPFEGQEAKWPKAAQKEYHALLKMASQTTVVSPGGYAAWKLHRRNEWMVDRVSDAVLSKEAQRGRLLALWDGSTSGGTFSCIQYAQKKRVEIKNAWGRYQKLCLKNGWTLT